MLTDALSNRPMSVFWPGLKTNVEDPDVQPSAAGQKRLSMSDSRSGGGKKSAAFLSRFGLNTEIFSFRTVDATLSL